MAEFEIILEPKQTAWFSYSQTTIEYDRDNCGIFCMVPTVGLEIDINAAKDIDVHFSLMHPTGRVIRDDPHVKVLAIDSGILPFQGIQFDWKPLVESGSSEA